MVYFMGFFFILEQTAISLIDTPKDNDMLTNLSRDVINGCGLDMDMTYIYCNEWWTQKAPPSWYSYN
jgi:hypothetical protein